MKGIHATLPGMLRKRASVWALFAVCLFGVAMPELVMAQNTDPYADCYLNGLAGLCPDQPTGLAQAERVANVYRDAQVDPSNYAICRRAIGERSTTWYVQFDVTTDKQCTFIYPPIYFIDRSWPKSRTCVKTDSLGQCYDPGKNNQCDAVSGPTQTGNPINMLVGNKTEVVHDYVDPSGGHLNFSRYYSSVSARANPGTALGQRWRHNYQIGLPAEIYGYPGIETKERSLNKPTGDSYIFRLLNGAWLPEADVSERLTPLTGSNGQITGWRVDHNDNHVEFFQTDGRLQRIEYPDGDVLTIAAQGTGFLISDRKGRSLLLTYQSSLLTSVTLPDGKLIKYAYDNGRLASVSRQRDEAGLEFDETRYVYEDANDALLLTGIIDESNQRYATWRYDSYGRATSSQHGDPAAGIDKVTVNYQANGSTVTNPLGETVTHNYITQFRRAKVSGSEKLCVTCGGVSAQSRTYDANGYPDVQTDFSGVATDNDYNARGLLVQTIESANRPATKRTTQSDWHPTLPLALETRVLDSSGALVSRQTRSYNARGQILASSSIDPQSPGATRTATRTYCEQSDVSAGMCPLLGLVTSADGARTDVADTTTYTYYAADHSACAATPATCRYRKGDVWKVTNALGQVVTENLRFDGAGRLLSSRDLNGVVTDLEYHPRGWMAASKVRGADDAVGTDDAITRFEYYPTGLVKKVTQPDGSFVRYEYDAAHRLTDIFDNADNRIHYTLDNAGNRTQEDTRDPGGSLKRTLSRIYNQLGQLTTAKTAQGHATGFSYDVNGNGDITTDALGRIADNDYDPLNRLTKTLQDVGGINAKTEFGYDALDRLTKVVDPKNLETRYGYNGLGDQVQLTSPDTGVSIYTYDSAGNRQTETDARGITRTYSYDALNRLTGVAYPTTSLNVGYQYDAVPTVCTAGETFAKGRLSLITDASGSTQYCYDRFGRTVRKVQTTNGKVFALRYAYTLAGQLSSLTYPDGAVVSYQRDALGRISRIDTQRAEPGAVPEVLLSQATYHAFGPVAGWVYGNGRTMSRQVDLDYRVTAINDPWAGGVSIGFDYDAVGNINKLRPVNATNALLAYDYDALNRLTHLRDGPTQVAIDSYTYDAIGNRMSFSDAVGHRSYVYSASSSRLNKIGVGAPRNYDAAGNVTAYDNISIDYDDEMRLASVKRNSIEIRKYLYSGIDERVYELNQGETYVYGHSGQLLGTYDRSGAAKQQVIWFDDLPIALIVEKAKGGDVFYIEPDHLATPRVVIDSRRNISVWSWDIRGEAFGNSSPNEDADFDGMLFKFDLRFPGQVYDEASGLHYNYFRDYDPAIGRYTESDPLGLSAGLSTYGYVGGRPLAVIDPTGLIGIDSVRATCLNDPAVCALLGASGAVAVAVAPKSGLLDGTSSATKSECNKANCKEQFPEYALCSELPGEYIYTYRAQAQSEFPPHKLEKPEATNTGPWKCVNKGVHWKVRGMIKPFKGKIIGSITSCECCRDTGGGPMLDSRFRVH